MTQAVKRFLIMAGDLFGILTIIAAFLSGAAIMTGHLASMVQAIGFLMIPYCISSTCHRMARWGDF